MAKNKHDDYEGFIEKFKPKKTTDDCYTPPLVYDAVKEWVRKEYGVTDNQVIRPFYPGGDYENYQYPLGCVVLDNPPFSILSKICEFYLDRGIKFFLFAPSLTVLSGKKVCMRMNHIITDSEIIYENGAVVRTAFVTNLGDGETILQTEPNLGEAIKKAVNQIRSKTTKNLPKYDYPNNIITAAMMQRYSKYGIEFKISRKDCVRVSRMDAQVECKKAIFGSGLLLSTDAANKKREAEKVAQEKAAQEKVAQEKAAQEKVAQEKAATHVWELSEREKVIIKQLDEKVKERR